MNQHSRFALGSAILTITLSSAYAVETATSTVSLGVDYTTGDYGTNETTDIVYVPLILKYESGPWIGKLTLPYIRITGPGDVLPDIGRVGTRTAPRRTEQGLGDVVASLTRAVYSGQSLLLDATGKVKFATADEDRGLGTGANDYSAQVDAYVPMGTFTPLASLGYRVLGDPPGTDLDNVIYASAGFTYAVDARVNAGAIFDYREPSSSRAEARRELLVFVSGKPQSGWSLQGYGVRGFSDDSPDWGVGVIVGRAY